MDEILDDTDDSGTECDIEFSWCVWCLKFWETTDCDCRGAWGAGGPPASSARRLRMFIMVGRNFDETDTNAANYNN